MSNLISQLRTSAEAGSVDAQFNLGVILCNGLDDKGHFVGGKREEALSWLARAANTGLLRAQFKLAETYADSESVDDLELACAWFLVASENAEGGGREAARQSLEKIERKLDAEQLERAQGYARTWNATIQTDRDKRARAIKPSKFDPIRDWHL